MKDHSLANGRDMPSLHSTVRCCCLALGMVCLNAWAIDCPARVRMAYLDAPVEPFINGRGKVADPPGLVVDWAIKALSATGCSTRVELSRQPVLRLERSLADDELDIVLAMALTPERERKHAFPDLSGKRLLYIGKADISLYARKGQLPAWSGQHAQLKRLKIGVARGQLPAAVAAEQGWSLEFAPDNASNFHKLERGRIPALLESNLVADPYFAANPLEGLQKLAPPVTTLHYYAPVSRDFQKAFPAFTEQFWLQLCRQSREVFKQLPACSLG